MSVETSKKSIDSISNEMLISIFENSRISLSAKDICNILAKRNINIYSYQIIPILRQLQQDGSLIFNMRKWSLPESNSAKGKAIFNYSGSLKNNDSIKSDCSNISWSPSSSVYFSTNKKLNDNVDEIVYQDDPSYTWQKENYSWDTFRCLVCYYADCIKNDGISEASAYFNQLNQNFICLSKTGKWYPVNYSIHMKKSNSWKTSIPVSSEMSMFLRNMGLQGETSSLFLGYPIHIFNIPKANEPDIVFVKPIFTYQLSWQAHALVISIYNEEPVCEINFDWLKFALKSNEQQKMFLASCGLINTESYFETGKLETYNNQNVCDFRTLAHALESFLPELIQETLYPESVSSHFPKKLKSGIYNKAVLMLGKKTKYTGTLIKELKSISKMPDEVLEKSALKYIFGPNPQQNKSKHTPSLCHEALVVDTVPLNHEQREAVASIMTKSLTVVTGPPGTGKSQVVSSAMINCRLSDQSVLFTSRNHKAIDSVVHRLVTKNSEALIIRSNSKNDPNLKVDFSNAIRILLLDSHDQQYTDQWIAKKNDCNILLKDRANYAEKAREYQNLKSKLGEIEEQIIILQNSMSKEAALELNEKYERFPCKEATDLFNTIKKYFVINDSPGIINKIYSWLYTQQVAFYVSSFNKKLSQNFKTWQLSQNSVKKERIKEIEAVNSIWKNAVQCCYLRMKIPEMEKTLEGMEPLDKTTYKIKEISDLLLNRSDEMLSLHLQSCQGLHNDTERSKLSSLQAALKTITQPHVETKTENEISNSLNHLSPLLLKHFPLWAVTNLAVGSRIPLVAGMFDCAVIDEASQCDIPSAIPILFRAKRAAVVGDPYQLSHITTIKQNKNIQLRKRYNVNALDLHRFSYSDTSLFDLFAQTNGINPLFLNETYRSVEAIASYSNICFYNNRLRVATNPDNCILPQNFQPGIHWTDIDSDIVASGRSGCCAPDEVRKIVDFVHQIIIEEQFEGTLGVVTPFREQANRIQDELFKTIPPEKREHAQLIIDTAHGFQGDERDVIVMSLCGGSEMPKGSAAFLGSTPNLMNVAVSRARGLLHIVGNRKWAEQSEYPHIRELALEKISSPNKYQQGKTDNSIKSKWYPHESPWEAILYDALIKKGIKPEPQYPVLGRRLDMALVKNNLKIDIEVDGDRFHRNPDGSRKQDDVWRDIQLQGAGWRVMRFWVYQLRENIDNCVEEIERIWNSNG
ncbi:MAG: DUF559 domain-containing protein [Desulfamplus sp.]|nr:DUF559 domain-containing protein [Desulfamplus sp.]